MIARAKRAPVPRATGRVPTVRGRPSRQAERAKEAVPRRGRVIITAAGAMWIAFGGAGLLAAVFLGAPWLGTIAFVAAGWVVAEEWYIRALLRLTRATRSLPGEVMHGERVHGRVEIAGRRRLPLFWGSVLAPLGLDLDRAREIRLPAVLAPGRRAVIEAEGPCNARRGWHQLHPAAVRAFGPLGLVGGQVPVDGPAEVLVLPAIERLGAWSARRSPRSRARADETLARRRAGWPTPTPRSLREYRPGDRFRDIHWKQTARLGSLVAIERERAVTGETWIWPDLHDYRDAAGQTLAPAAGEEVVRVCASVGWTLAQHGVQVGLATRPAAGPEIAPGAGPTHAARWLSICATLSPAGSAPPQQALEEWTTAGINPAELVCIFAAAAWPPAALLDRLLRLASAGWSIVPVLVEDISQARVFDLERRIWSREYSASDLWRAFGEAGLPLHLVPLGARLETALLGLAWEVGRA